MRRSTVILCLAASAISLLAACGGSGSDDETPEPTATSPVTTTPTQAATPASNLTPVSAGGTPGAATPAASPSATATTAVETPLAAPTQAQAQPTTAAPPPPPPPTATTPAQSGNPIFATVGVSGSVRFFWSPNTVTVAPGGTVTWAWNEPVQPHSVVGDNFPLSSAISKSDAVSHTFAAAGTYTFYCETHPDTMRGKVVVQ